MRRLLFLIPVVLLGFVGLSLSRVSRATECDNNNVIHCGVASPSQLTSSYRDSGVAAIYGWANISRADINNMASQSLSGSVTKSGDVFVGGKLVATNAISVGRQNIAGSKAITSGGVSFYSRPTSVSFVQASLPAYVMMKNGRFSFAILPACGNPVMATPLMPAKPPLKKMVSKPQQKPINTPAPSAPAQSQTQTQSQSVTINSPPSVQAATTTQPASTPAVSHLPNTGAGNVIALAGSATLLGSAGHWLFSRRNRRF